jgi:hypothetical protein
MTLNMQGIQWEILQLNCRAAYDYARKLTIVWSPILEQYQVINERCAVLFQNAQSCVCLEEATSIIRRRILSKLN